MSVQAFNTAENVNDSLVLALDPEIPIICREGR